jgi:hypothetical protein
MEKLNHRWFIIGGMPRAGTTFLYNTLQKHPGLFLPYRKEINFFHQNFNKGLDWYLEFFKEIKSEQISVDASPAYFLYNETAARIRESLHDVKILLGIRRPSEFVISFYYQMKGLGSEMPPFIEFCQKKWLKKGGIFEDNFFPNRMRDYMEVFKNDLLLYDFSRFQLDPLVILLGIEKFLELDAYFSPNNFQNIRINTNTRKESAVLWRFWRFVEKPWVQSIVGKTIPSKVVKKVRSRIDHISAVRGQGAVEMAYADQENVCLARKLFRDQDIFVEEFFNGSTFVAGSGKPWS